MTKLLYRPSYGEQKSQNIQVILRLDYKMTKSVEDRVTERNQKTFGPDFDFTVPTGFPAIRFYRNLFSPIHRRLHFQK